MDFPALLSDVQVAQFLGFSRRKIRSMDSMGHLPMSLKIGRSRRWRRDELERWIAAGCPCRRVWSTVQQ